MSILLYTTILVVLLAKEFGKIVKTKKKGGDVLKMFIDDEPKNGNGEENGDADGDAPTDSGDTPEATV